MNVSIDPDVKTAYPDLKVSILIINSEGNLEFTPELMNTKKELETWIRKEYQNPENLERVKKYNKFYKKYSSKVPMEFQIRSILEGKEIPKINPVITAMFMAELKNAVLTAGHDLDKIGEQIKVFCSQGTEEYTKINKKEQTLKKNDIFADDGTSIISSVLYGPDSRTQITSETRNFMFMCYFPFEISDDEIKDHMNDIAKFLQLAGKVKMEETQIA